MLPAAPGFFLGTCLVVNPRVHIGKVSPASTSSPGAANMGAATLEISDDQIEALLSEAESRLASNASEQHAISKVNQPEAGSLAVRAASGEVGQQGETVKKSKDLSVRVPQLVAKKSKVRPIMTFPVLLHDEIKSQISMKH